MVRQRFFDHLVLLWCRDVVLFWLVTVLFSFIECSSSQRSMSSSSQFTQDDSTEQQGANNREDNPAIDRRKLLNSVMMMMGTPSNHNGFDSVGFDCSGFTSKIYFDCTKKALPHSTREQYASGRAIAWDSLKFGDLVFFNTKGPHPSHVGIYVGDRLFAHASVKSGVTISLLESDYYKKRFIGARRIIE